MFTFFSVNVHWDKSLGAFRAIAWSALNFPRLKIRAIAGYSIETRTIASYSWEYSQVLLY